MTDSGCIEVLRGDAVESRHRIHIAVVDAGGVLRASLNDSSLLTFARSAVKAVQAMPLLDDGAADAFGFGSEEIALCCASHSGEPVHVALAAKMLARIGATEADLACGAHPPFDRSAAAALESAGVQPGRLHNNCSGKHAGMMTLARHHGWPIEGYHERGHPVQQRMAAELARWSSVPVEQLATGVDGCGVVTFGLPLASLALVFARLAAATAAGEGHAARVVNAMLRHPELVAGTDRLCTSLMQASDGRVFAKVGAEGVYCAGVPGTGIGIAIKAEDGAQRAAEPALLSVLTQLGVFDAKAHASLSRWSVPLVRNTRGEVVGSLRPAFTLVHHAAR